MEDEAHEVALKRAKVLRPLLSLLDGEQEVGAAVAAVASELDVSRSTAWRFLALLREADGRASALLPKRSGPRRGSLRLSQQVEELVDRVLRERYLVLERSSFRRTVSEIRAECGAKGLQAADRGELLRCAETILENMHQQPVDIS